MLPALIAAGGGILGGVLGGIFGGADREKAEQAQAEAQKLIEAIGAGPDLARTIMLNTFQQAGVLTPEVEQAIHTEMDNQIQLQERPEMRREQEMELQALKQLSRRGLGVEDQAAFNKLRGQAAADTQAKQEQILQGMAQRGMGGGGQELAMQIAAAQSGAQSEAEAADRIAAEASQARRGALKDVFSGAGQMRAADLAVDTKNLENKMRQAEFNAANSLQRQERNVNRSTQANIANLGRQQQVSDTNIGQSNAELNRQRQAEQTMYENKVRQAQMLANLKQGQAQQHSQNAANTQQSWTGMGSALGQGIGGAMQHQQDKDWFQSNFGKTAPVDATTAPIPSSSSFTMPTFGKRYNQGGRIPGNVVTDHDHPANDQVDAKLSPGEIVVPRSFAKHPEAAKAFIESLFTKEESGE